MLEKIKKYYRHPIVKELLDPNNIGLYVFVIIVVALTWSAIGVVQSNYRLQKQIAKSEQEIMVLDLTNRNQQLKNQYYQSNEYLELSARKQYGKVSPGEKVITIPHEVAMKHAANLPTQATEPNSATLRSKNGIQKNLQDWFDFFTHRLATEP